MKYKPHPVASLLPLMDESALATLTADIAANGLREPIWLLDGKILDGRNRLAACEQAAIAPRFREYKGDKPLQFILSMNLHRRHLNESQRALIAAKLANMPEGRPGKTTASIEAVSQPDAAGTAHESSGEWFKLGAQLYFYAWANETQADFARWLFLDIVRYKLLIEQAGGLSALGQLKRNSHHGAASFYAIPVCRLGPAILATNFPASILTIPPNRA